MEKTIGVVTFAVVNGRDVKATVEGGNGAHFENVGLDTLAAKFQKYARQLRDHLKLRFLSFPGQPLDEQLLSVVVAEATLNAMWLARGAPLTPRWLDVPSTQRVVQQAVKRKWPRNKEKVAAVTAHLLGLTPEQYALWLEAEDRFQNR